MNWESIAVGVLSAIAGSGGAFLALRDRLNKSDTTAATEDAKQNILKVLMDERDEAKNEAREAVDQRTLLASEVSRLKELNAASDRERMRLSDEFSAFRRMVLRLHPEMSEFLVSHPGDLDERQPPKGNAL